MELRCHQPLMKIIIPWLLFLFFFCFYLLFAQANPPNNSLEFISLWVDQDIREHPHHLIWGKWVACCSYLGEAIGLREMTTGLVQVALMMSLSLCLYFRFLCRLGMGLWIAGLFSSLLGLSGAAMQYATCVEPYGACLFAILLSLFAFQSLLERDNPRNRIWLWLTGLLVLSLHAGLAFWILALYLTLFWRDRSSPGKACSWILQGAALAMVFLLCLYLAGCFNPRNDERADRFLAAYWMTESDAGVWWYLLKAPLFQMALYAGLLVYPLCRGWRVFRGNQPDLFRLCVLSTLFFYGCYAFWVTERGRFFIALFPLWGLMAAWGSVSILQSRKASVLAILGAILYSGLFLFLPLFGEVQSNMGFSLLLAIAFILVCIVSCFFRQQEDSRKESLLNEASSKARIVYGIIALILTASVYLPHAWSLTKPDEAGLALEEFVANTSEDARLVTGVWQLHAEAQTGRECIDATPLDQRVVDTLTHWLRECGQPDKPPLFFDPPCHEYRQEIWKAGSGVEPPLSEFEFVPLKTEHCIFYRVVPVKP